jgi:hypothetical protein
MLDLRLDVRVLGMKMVRLIGAIKELSVIAVVGIPCGKSSTINL